MVSKFFGNRPFLVSAGSLTAFEIFAFHQFEGSGILLAQLIPTLTILSLLPKNKDSEDNLTVTPVYEKPKIDLSKEVKEWVEKTGVTADDTGYQVGDEILPEFFETKMFERQDEEWLKRHGKKYKKMELEYKDYEYSEAVVFEVIGYTLRQEYRKKPIF